MRLPRLARELGRYPFRPLLVSSNCSTDSLRLLQVTPYHAPTSPASSPPHGAVERFHLINQDLSPSVELYNATRASCCEVSSAQRTHHGNRQKQSRSHNEQDEKTNSIKSKCYLPKSKSNSKSYSKCAQKLERAREEIQITTTTSLTYEEFFSFPK